ncbi:hypothetical protein BDZ90DRAFT_274123 [Jaminaea rosea]|uniref:rRNA adenine N(6)-methyltransferase n=1 Tax=Jaminaea rosea TaxID=1569628 RepID=A0A316UVL6_9BASI|nr:hypothetical protein BDZ90DRAFT_274123 [Jaminaea rosea]PWN28371.1 hypothetical protein BDZ90DRAFT_274123 [Jaminaea rosea]
MRDRTAIKKFVDGLELESIVEQNGGQKVTIIESFAGPGTITSELISRKEVGRVIAMETSPKFTWALESLKEDPTLVDAEGKGPKDKLFFYHRDEGYHWWAYQELEQYGAFSQTKTWAEDPSRPAHQLAPVVFVSQLPNTVHGDQLYTQLIAAMGNGGWIFPYGRIKLAFVMPETLAKRATANAGSAWRARIGTLGGIYAWQRIIQSAQSLEPQTDCFWPENLRAQRRTLRNAASISNENMASGSSQLAMCTLTAVPKVRQVQAWRRLAGLQSQIPASVLEEEKAHLQQEAEQKAQLIRDERTKLANQEAEMEEQRKREAAVKVVGTREKAMEEKLRGFDAKIAQLKAEYKELRGEDITDEDIEVEYQKVKLLLARERRRQLGGSNRSERRARKKGVAVSSSLMDTAAEQGGTAVGETDSGADAVSADGSEGLSPSSDELASGTTLSQLRQGTGPSQTPSAGPTLGRRDFSTSARSRSSVDPATSSDAPSASSGAATANADADAPSEQETFSPKRRRASAPRKAGGRRSDSTSAPPAWAATLESLRKVHQDKLTYLRLIDGRRTRLTSHYENEAEARQLKHEEAIKAAAEVQASEVVEALCGIEVESLDYLLRGVYVLRSKSISTALARTFPGAESVLKRIGPDAEAVYEKQLELARQRAQASGDSNAQTLTPPPLPPKSLRIHPDTPVCDLTDEQWILLARTFERWPFRPAHLFDESKLSSAPRTKSTSKDSPNERGATWTKETMMAEVD